MFVRLSFPSVLNSHVKGADGADLRLLLVLEMRRGEEKETSQSGNTAQRDELSGWEMSPGARCLSRAVTRGRRGVSAL